MDAWQWFWHEWNEIIKYIKKHHKPPKPFHHKVVKVQIMVGCISSQGG